MNLNDKQKKAIALMNKALKELEKADILICGMDDQLLYATKEAVNSVTRVQANSDYCEVAMANQKGVDESTGHFKAKCYQDSGAW